MRRLVEGITLNSPLSELCPPGTAQALTIQQYEQQVLEVAVQLVDVSHAANSMLFQREALHFADAMLMSYADNALPPCGWHPGTHGHHKQQHHAAQTWLQNLGSVEAAGFWLCSILQRR